MSVLQVTKIEECGGFDETEEVFVKLRFLVLRPDGSVKSDAIHRFTWAPGVDFEMSLPEIQAALIQMGEIPFSPRQIERIRKEIGLWHTPEAIERKQERDRLHEEAFKTELAKKAEKDMKVL